MIKLQGEESVKLLEEHVETNVIGAEKTLDQEWILDEIILLTDALENLRSKLNCYGRIYDSRVCQRGDFWKIKNHGPICYEQVTLTTYVDLIFLDNLDALVERSVK